MSDYVDRESCEHSRERVHKRIDGVRDGAERRITAVSRWLAGAILTILLAAISAGFAVVNSLGVTSAQIDQAERERVELRQVQKEIGRKLDRLIEMNARLSERVDRVLKERTNR